MLEGIKSFFNSEAKDPTPEADKLTGRTAEDVVDDTSERQEHFTSPEGRAEKLYVGVGKVMDEFSVPSEQALAEWEYVALKLKEKGFVTPQDESMSGYEGTLKETIKAVAGARMKERERKQNERKIN